MAEQSELFDLSKKHLIGKLVTSTVSSGKIADISMPSENQFRHMLVLSAADFDNRDGIEVMDEEFPIFARDEVFYKGQPVLAVFGYDSEDVDLFCRQVKVSYQIMPDSENSGGRLHGSPFAWSYGNTDDFFTSKAKTFKSSFEVVPFSNTMLGDLRIFATQREGKFHVRLASQWPIHVRKSIAHALGIDIDDILLYPQSYYSPYDQLVLEPSVLCCIAAMAAQQSGELVQISAPMVSWQPRMRIEHETAFHDDGTLLADRASCTIDLGAYPFFASEVCSNVLAGLVPVYPMKAADVSIQITSSSTAPASFFGDLGYSMALAGTENHFSQLASAIGVQPGIWRLNRVNEIKKDGNPLCESVKQGSDFDKLKKSLKEVLDKSWYSRKYSANSQKRMMNLRMNPMINYSRGIGIGCGQSIFGFSQQFNANANYSLSVTLDEDNTVKVTTGMTADKGMQGLWKDTIRKFLEVPSENIVFADINDHEVIDMGPSALSRKMGIVSALLVQACSEIARKKQFSRLPITVSTQYDAELTDPFYCSSSIGSVVMDLHIDTVVLSPIIDNIWVNFHLGHVFDMERLLNKARHTITAVLSDICPRSTAKCNIDIKISQDGSFTSSSLTSGLRGLTTAALVNALSQALGHTIKKIPVTSDDILAIAGKSTFPGDRIFSREGGEKEK